MLSGEYFLIDDVEKLRRQIFQAEEGDKRRQLWTIVSRSVRSSKYDFAWYAPFVALMTGAPEDIANARDVMRAYLDKLEIMNFCTGLQFHFWCFAFPHAKMCVYFQWLCEMGVYSEEEKEEISAILLNYQFTNFYYGMRTKPEPECVDNQVLSLALSNVIVGYLFSQNSGGEIAKILLRDGMRRLPAVIGGFPRCGYTGEGTRYMDVVIGPSIWVCVEMLERIWGEKDLLYRPFPPSMVRPIDLLRMVANEWMPGGLLLPWDNYGYQMGVRSGLAYVAKKTGDAIYCDKLDQAVLSYDVGAGWSYDDLVWTLVHYPDENKHNAYARNWFVKEVGGVIENGELYAFQMWDETTPNFPTRAHCNPNAVVFNAFKTPLSADGSKAQSCRRFDFDNTWKTVGFLKMNEETRYNYGDGCAGAHSCVLIDGDEAMMARGEEQICYENCRADESSVTGDATPIYRQNYPDIRRVSRTTRILGEKFYLVEDFVEAASPHAVTSRFFFRPELVPAKKGVKICVDQGVSLQLVPLNKAKIRTETVEGYPRIPDCKSVLADVETPAASKVCNRVLLFPARTVVPLEKQRGFAGVFADGDLTVVKARKALKSTSWRFDLELPPYMEKEVPIRRKWWFEKKFTLAENATHLILPIGFIAAKLWLNGEEIDLSPWHNSTNFLPTYVEIPEKLRRKELDMLFFSEVPIDHYENGGDGRTGLFGGVSTAARVREEQILDASYENGVVSVRTDAGQYRYECAGGEEI